MNKRIARCGICGEYVLRYEILSWRWDKDIPDTVRIGPVCENCTDPEKRHPQAKFVE